MTYFSSFNGKTIIVTGHTGFKGSWLALWLKTLGAKVVGLGLEPHTNPSHFDSARLKEIVEDHRFDITNTELVNEFVLKTQPDYVFHLAAQSLVRKSYEDPKSTYSTNAIGTLNLLEALRNLKKKCSAVLITSDKCYQNVEWIWGYRETDSLGGSDPYSASKGAAEMIIHSYVKSFFPVDGLVKIGIARAGNVIGGGDWSQDRIVPDCVRSWAKNESVKLRKAEATRPWQHVLEPLSGYLILATELNNKETLHGEPFNFGPDPYDNYTVLNLVELMSRYWEKVNWENSTIQEKVFESGLLKLNCDKAFHQLKWRAVLPFQETIRMTVEWYKSYYNNPSKIRDISLSQIREYEFFAKEKNMPWMN